MADDGSPARHTFVWGVLGGVVMGVAPFVPGETLWNRAIGFGLCLAGVSALVVRRRMRRLQVGDALEYRRLGLHLTLPRTAAQAVFVQRELSVGRPCAWSLRVVARERAVHIPIAEHWLFGTKTQRRATALAQGLDIPLEDPVGDRWRQSRFAPMRWLGAGYDWLFYGALFLVVGGALLGSTFGYVALFR